MSSCVEPCFLIPIARENKTVTSVKRRGKKSLLVPSDNSVILQTSQDLLISSGIVKAVFFFLFFYPERRAEQIFFPPPFSFKTDVNGPARVAPPASSAVKADTRQETCLRSPPSFQSKTPAIQNWRPDFYCLTLAAAQVP